MKILVVDDHATNSKLLRAWFEAEGHAVLEAGDGLEALALLETESVDAIVSDVLMPNMDGFRLCEEVRSRPHLSVVPFIICTGTYDSPTDRVLGERLGADRYLVRPVPVPEILQAIEHARGERTRTAPEPGEVSGDYIVRKYSAALIAKLEEKNLALGRANEELRLLRDQLQRVLEHSPAVIYSLKVSGDSAAPYLVSENVSRLLGYSVPEALAGGWWNSHIHPEDRERASAAMAQVLATGSSLAQYRMRHRDGHYLWVEDRQCAVEDAGATHISGVWTNISYQKQSEERLREQAELLDKASDAILVKDLDGHIKYWNNGAARMLGWTAREAEGRLSEDFLEKDGLNLWQARQALLRHGEWSGETRMTSKTGGEVLAQSRWTLLRDADGCPKAVLSINTDITEKKRLEAQFLRTQRIESIGALASGVVHDLNNVLSPVLTSLALLREPLEEPERLRLIESLELNLKRGSGIVNQVLAFGRGMQGERVVLDPIRLLKEMRLMIQETFPKGIRLECRFGENVWNVRGDPIQLHQVLLNLCINARDAMPQGGTLGLGARNVVFDNDSATLDPKAPAGAYVLLEVSDSGLGIDPELQERIFEPFFTTKEPGRGTGLGLSTVAAILKSHHGFIQLTSEPGRGTVFHAFVPAAPSSAAHATDTRTVNMPRGNGECILIVDDEAMILDVTRTTLERFGYRTITATDGAAGVGLYAQHRGEIRAVITDMVMPIMDGAATLHALQKMNPSVRVIVASGWGQEGLIPSGLQTHFLRCLQKPYSTNSLLEMLHELLTATASDPANPA